jgi:hypothetical protein
MMIEIAAPIAWLVASIAIALGAQKSAGLGLATLAWRASLGAVVAIVVVSVVDLAPRYARYAASAERVESWADDGESLDGGGAHALDDEHGDMRSYFGDLARGAACAFLGTLVPAGTAIWLGLRVRRRRRETGHVAWHRAVLARWRFLQRASLAALALVWVGALGLAIAPLARGGDALETEQAEALCGHDLNPNRFAGGGFVERVDLSAEHYQALAATSYSGRFSEQPGARTLAWFPTRTRQTRVLIVRGRRFDEPEAWVDVPVGRVDDVVATSDGGFALAAYAGHDRVVHFVSRDGRVRSTQRLFTEPGRPTIDVRLFALEGGGVVAVEHRWAHRAVEVYRVSESAPATQIFHTEIEEDAGVGLSAQDGLVCIVTGRDGTLARRRGWGLRFGPGGSTRFEHVDLLSRARVWPIELESGRVVSASLLVDRMGWAALLFVLALHALFVFGARRASSFLRALRRGNAIAGETDAPHGAPELELVVDGEPVRVDASRAIVIGVQAAHRVVIPRGAREARAPGYREQALASLEAACVVSGSRADAERELEVAYRARLGALLLAAWASLLLLLPVLVTGL